MTEQCLLNKKLHTLLEPVKPLRIDPIKMKQTMHRHILYKDVHFSSWQHPEN